LKLPFIASSLSLVFASLLQAQELKFDVVSIKPIQSDPSTDRFLFARGRTLRSSATLSALIQWAYQNQDFRSKGLPDWVQWHFYLINAKAEGDVELTAEQFRQMARNLLSDRFQLSVHTETEDIDVLALVVDNKGLKIKESPPGAVPSEQRFNGRLEATHYGIAKLVHRLNQGLDRKVIDETGLTGFYDLKLAWTPESSALAASSDSSAPSIFTAVQTQLGLKLELRKKYPINMVVIDRAEKPTGN
jgi:uncharacterized protein (TIGR03435 family)